VFGMTHAYRRADKGSIGSIKDGVEKVLPQELPYAADICKLIIYFSGSKTSPLKSEMQFGESLV